MGDLTANFSRWEFACPCGCGYDTVDYELLLGLQAVRFIAGMIRVNSGCRCRRYNDSLPDSAVNSQHIHARAVDIASPTLSPRELLVIVRQIFGETVSIGVYETHLHIDNRTGEKTTWSEM